jgi:membrane protein required for colicin V production
MTMNWVDVIIVLIVALATFSSLRAGFLRQALTSIGFVVGVYAALSHHQTVAKPFEALVRNHDVATIVAFVLILIAVWVAFAMLAAIARRVLKASGLAWTDNLLGMVVGLLAGSFFTVCFLLLVIRIPFFGISDAVQRSVLASLIFRVLPHLTQLLPRDLHKFTAI